MEVLLIGAGYLVAGGFTARFVGKWAAKTQAERGGFEYGEMSPEACGVWFGLIWPMTWTWLLMEALILAVYRLVREPVGRGARWLTGQSQPKPRTELPRHPWEG